MNEKQHPWEFWLHKPVIVQLREPLALFADVGPCSVDCQKADGTVETVQFGSPSPFKSQDETPIAMQLSGTLSDDPVHPERLMMNLTMTIGAQRIKFCTSIHPAMIAYVSVIPQHQSESRLIT